MAYINNYTKEEQKALAIEKVMVMLDKANTDVVSVFDNAAFPDYLEFVSRFHYFDVNNTLLIYKQTPDATFIASFKAWSQFSMDCWGDPNRPVFSSSQKGKGIGILAPYILKKKADNNPASGRAISYFDYHVVFVFDKSQTNGIPAPVMSWDLSRSKEDCRALFNAFREKAAFTITFSDSPASARRFSYVQAPNSSAADMLILNSADMDNHYLLCSFIIKHFVVQSLKDTLQAASREEFQKICECVTFVLASYFKLPTDRDSFFFVKFWGGNDPKKMLGILNTVQIHAHNLIEILEEEIIFQKSMSSTDVPYDDEGIFDFEGDSPF